MERQRERRFPICYFIPCMAMQLKPSCLKPRTRSQEFLPYAHVDAGAQRLLPPFAALSILQAVSWVRNGVAMV